MVEKVGSAEGRKNLSLRFSGLLQNIFQVILLAPCGSMRSTACWGGDIKL